MKTKLFGLAVCILMLFSFLASIPFFVASVHASTTIFSDGFESGSFSAWTGTRNGDGGTIVVQKTTVYSGVYASQTSIAAEQWSAGEAYYDFASTYSQMDARDYINFNATPPSSGNILGDFICIVDVGNNNVFANLGLYNSAGTVEWRFGYRNNGAEVDVYSAAPTISVNTWYYLEVAYTAGKGTGQAQGYINGNLVFNETGLTNNDILPQEVTVGAITTATTLHASVFTDDVVVSTAYIGP